MYCLNFFLNEVRFQIILMVMFCLCCAFNLIIILINGYQAMPIESLKDILTIFSLLQKPIILCINRSSGIKFEIWRKENLPKKKATLRLQMCIRQLSILTSWILIKYFNRLKTGLGLNCSSQIGTFCSVCSSWELTMTCMYACNS